MNPGAPQLFARGFLSGLFDVVSAVAGEAATFSPEPPRKLEALDLKGALTRCPVVIRSAITGGGAIALLISEVPAARFFATASGQSSETIPLEKADPDTLKEVFEPCMGGGVSRFKAKYGQAIAIESVVIGLADDTTATKLRGLFGPGACAVPFSFAIPNGGAGEGFMLFSEQFEKTIPDTVIASETGGAGVGTPLSPDNVNDLAKANEGGGDVEPSASSSAPSGAASAGSANRNLDMVLDIRMVATARLGRVEMPINEILSLGPGSIIEVGHLVDEPVELLVNDKLIARGDVVVVDERFGLRITEIVSPRERIESLR